MSRNKIVYWASTVIVCMLVLFSATMYLVNYQDVVDTFLKLGHPAHVVLPLAIAKILAVVAIVTRKNQTLKEWAYAGLFFDFLLASGAHYAAQDGEWPVPLVFTVVLLVSYIFEKKAFAKN